MSVNLIDAAKSLFTNDLVSKVSSQLGENESGISKALSGIVPGVFSGLLQKVNTHDGAATVSKMVQDQRNSGILGDLGNYFSPANNDLSNKSSGLLGGLFGGQSDMLSNLISNFSGVKSNSAKSLLSMALPAILALIGKHTSGNEPSAISSLLNSQKDNIRSAMPAGLNIGSLFGGMGDGAAKVVSGTKAYVSDRTTDSVQNSSNKWLMPLLLLIGAGILAYFLLGKGCNKEKDVVINNTDTVQTSTDAEINNTTAINTTGRYDSVTNEYIYNVGNMITIDLPNGAGKLEVGENSTENKLYKFLSDSKTVIDTEKGNWFEFTNVKFKTGSSEITEESTTQLKNLVAISKGFPTAKFKLGGYTDNTGNAANNIALSKKRAEAVVANLKKLGAAAASIDGAEGYGPEWPVADNGTAEGRAQNRRVAVNVKSK